MDEIATRIFELATRKGLSGKELAQLLGTTDKKVSAWRTGRAKTYRDYYDKLAEVLETTVEYLRTGTTAPASPVDASFEDEEILRQIHDSPDMRALFSLTSKATSEDVRKALKIMRITMGLPEELP